MPPFATLMEDLQITLEYRLNRTLSMQEYRTLRMRYSLLLAMARRRPQALRRSRAGERSSTTPRKFG